MSAIVVDSAEVNTSFNSIKDESFSNLSSTSNSKTTFKNLIKESLVRYNKDNKDDTNNTDNANDAVAEKLDSSVKVEEQKITNLAAGGKRYFDKYRIDINRMRVDAEQKLRTSVQERIERTQLESMPP